MSPEHENHQVYHHEHSQHQHQHQEEEMGEKKELISHTENSTVMTITNENSNMDSNDYDNLNLKDTCPLSYSSSFNSVASSVSSRYSSAMSVSVLSAGSSVNTSKALENLIDDDELRNLIRKTSSGVDVDDLSFLSSQSYATLSTLGSGCEKNSRTQEQRQSKWIKQEKEHSNYSRNATVLKQQHPDDDGLAIVSDDDNDKDDSSSALSTRLDRYLQELRQDDPFTPFTNSITEPSQKSLPSLIQDSDISDDDDHSANASESEVTLSSLLVGNLRIENTLHSSTSPQPSSPLRIRHITCPKDNCTSDVSSTYTTGDTNSDVSSSFMSTYSQSPSSKSQHFSSCSSISSSTLSPSHVLDIVDDEELRNMIRSNQGVNDNGADDSNDSNYKNSTHTLSGVTKHDRCHGKYRQLLISALSQSHDDNDRHHPLLTSDAYQRQEEEIDDDDISIDTDFYFMIDQPIPLLKIRSYPRRTRSNGSIYRNNSYKIMFYETSIEILAQKGKIAEHTNGEDDGVRMELLELANTQRSIRQELETLEQEQQRKLQQKDGNDDDASKTDANETIWSWLNCCPILYKIDEV
mmetsp:Transcript_25778/g.37809  ORF Transcript_25778/g.37809 Transcript_25778/m.37809 type:complete len:578 (+) Transcript_25778:41-1774(+)